MPVLLEGVEATASVGTVTAQINVTPTITGLEATASVGGLPSQPVGVEATGAVGVPSINGTNTVGVTGVEGTGAVGSVTVSGDAPNIPVTGIAASSAVASDATLSDLVTGVPAVLAVMTRRSLFATAFAAVKAVILGII